jgi:hypothetical protein
MLTNNAPFFTHRGQLYAQQQHNKDDTKAATSLCMLAKNSPFFTHRGQPYAQQQHKDDIKAATLT